MQIFENIFALHILSIVSLHRRLETILKEGTNIEAEEEKAKKKISSINAKRVELAKQYKTNIAVLINLLPSCFNVRILYIERKGPILFLYYLIQLNRE